MDYNEWLENLKTGDEVCVFAVESSSGQVFEYVDVVKKVLPTRLVVRSDHFYPFTGDIKSVFRSAQTGNPWFLPAVCRVIPNTPEARQTVLDKIEFKRLASRVGSLLNRLTLDEVRDVEAMLTRRVTERTDQDDAL